MSQSQRRYGPENNQSRKGVIHCFFDMDPDEVVLDGWVYRIVERSVRRAPVPETLEEKQLREAKKLPRPMQDCHEGRMVRVRVAEPVHKSNRGAVDNPAADLEAVNNLAADAAQPGEA